MVGDVFIGMALCVLLVCYFSIETIGVAWVWVKLMCRLRHEPGVAGVLIGVPMLTIGFWGAILTGFPLFKMMLAVSITLLCGGLLTYASYLEEATADTSVSAP